MRTLLIAALISAPAIAQVSVEVSAPPPPRVTVRAPRVVAPPPPRVHLEPPSVHFSAPPPMVVVRPGVQVVEGSRQEVFFTGGYYWHCGSDGTWWRTRNHRGGWRVAPRNVVPIAVVHGRGHYRNFHAHAHFGKHARHASIRSFKKSRRG